MSASITYKPDGSKTYLLDGVEVSEREFNRRVPKRGIEAGHAPIGHLPGCWPMYSDQLGINPDGRAAATENLKRMGVPTEFTKDGRAILTSRRHRKQLAEVVGVHDRSPKASWGDP